MQDTPHYAMGLAPKSDLPHGFVSASVYNATPAQPALSFSNFGSARPLPASGGRGQRKLMSASMPPEYQGLADSMQSKCEDGILFLFRGVHVFRYWTQYPGSLTLLVAIPEAQFQEEFKGQFGAFTLDLFLQQCPTAPFNFPIHPPDKLPAEFPKGCLAIKVRVSAAMLNTFRDRRESGSSFEDAKDKYRTDVSWDMYIVPTLYHANANIEVPGFSFRLHRVEARPSLR